MAYNKNAVLSCKTFPQPEKDFCIYALICPDTKQIKYIGLTTQGFGRIRSHYNCEFKENTRKINWIKKLKSQNKIFDVQYLQYCNTIDELKIAETFWITHYKNLGVELLNHTNGGEDVYRPKYTEEWKQEHSRQYKLKFADPALRKKLSDAHMGLPGHRKGQKYSSDVLAKITQANKNAHGIKIKDQHGTVYPTIRDCAKILKCSVNTIKDRLLINKDKPLKGLLLSYCEEK